MPAEIAVTRTGGTDPMQFAVTVTEGRSESRHQVTMAAADCARLVKGAHTPEDCITAAFRFLLDREAKESILGRFDVSVIARYFPEFERALPNYLK